MKELEELTAEIREKLPRLKEKYTLYGKVTVLKDPMLNDVLEWFKYSDVRDGVNMMYEWIWIDTVKEILRLWDLSKPYLKDQSPELIKFLHGFINH